MNIKARVISLIKEVENGKFSNIALNEYFKENNLSKKEKQKQRLKIDYDNLFAEFKTILKRELSKEDKKIINIAYNMGRKNKFLSNNNKK